MIYRHGDVILRQVKGVPLGKIVSATRSLVLAEGETTGHKHLLTSDEVIQEGRTRNDRLISLNAPALLTHEEHGPITIQIGVYEILQEREYDYLGRHNVPVVD